MDAVSTLQWRLEPGMRLVVALAFLFAALFGCDSGDEDEPGSPSYGGGAGSNSKYYCGCEGDGLAATIEVYASSISEATSYANSMCRQDYPSANCSCQCSLASGSSSSSGTGTAGPPCTDECSPHFALTCDYGPDGTLGTWKCQEYWVDNVRCLHWVWKGTDYFDDACD